MSEAIHGNVIHYTSLNRPFEASQINAIRHATVSIHAAETLCRFFSPAIGVRNLILSKAAGSYLLDHRQPTCAV